MPDWATDMIGVFLGAVLGALFGYGANWWYQRQQIKARRAAIIRAIQTQFFTIPFTPEGPSPDSLRSKRTFHVTAAQQLLDGHTLDGTKDASFIRALTRWQASEARYNAAVHLANHASISADTHPHMLVATHEYVDQMHNELRLNMLFVQKFLPPWDDVEYIEADPWPEPWVIEQQERAEREEQERAERGDSSVDA